MGNLFRWQHFFFFYKADVLGVLNIALEFTFKGDGAWEPTSPASLIHVVLPNALQ